MASSGYDNGSLQRGGNLMDVPWRPGGSVGYGTVYGPTGGQAVAERAANVVNMRKVMNPGNSGSSALTLPVIIVIGVIAWYALRSYE